MYGEPDLVDLLPAYYCNYMLRCRQSSSLWKNYQTIYLQHMFSQNEDPTSDNSLNMVYETFQSRDVTSVTDLIDDLRIQMEKLKNEIQAINKWRSDINSILTKIQWEQDGKIKNVVATAFEVYEADDIGLMDYAAAYSGGSVVEISSETKPHPTHKPFSFFKLINVDLLSTPEEILRPCILPGSCFAFWGSYGKIKIRLGKAIEVGGVTLSHASRLLLGLGGSSSAPKEFEVHGFVNEKDRLGTHLGQFVYDWTGKQHQTFKITERQAQNKKFEFVSLTILSNYGHDEFTCVYRFRVHEKTHKEKHSGQKHCC